MCLHLTSEHPAIHPDLLAEYPMMQTVPLSLPVQNPDDPSSGAQRNNSQDVQLKRVLSVGSTLRHNPSDRNPIYDKANLLPQNRSTHTGDESGELMKEKEQRANSVDSEDSSDELEY
ncbi:hypothetical protein E4U09_004769 [Claviceps aff. purpurea]|uniref:Uncharacterized protein n=1 Tax=Claviceps aff. purpurea TaxID=1967640 RepID=A0A9P7U4C1_9HYPO|nr:hypothetical protein E4U09_004769 [Claviceps aff. purpurea]